MIICLAYTSNLKLHRAILELNIGINIEELIKEIPLGRFGDPEEIAHLASFICSEEASYITGQVIHINGGLYM